MKRIIFFGKAGSGKTELAKRIAGVYSFEENTRPTIGIDFFAKNTNSGIKLQLWDLSGNPRYESITRAYYRGMDAGVFCVDLTTEVDEGYLNEQIALFKQNSPMSPIILVGTKSDSSKANIEALNRLNETGLFSKVITTSAKLGTGVEDLLKEIDKNALHKIINTADSVFNPAANKFSQMVLEIPEWEKRQALEKQLQELKQKLDIDLNTPEDKAHAINEFTNNCQVILEGKYSNVWNAVLTLAAVAAVTVIAALVGFGIGFALGLWTGPGAFITGLVAGSMAAVAVATSSAALGALAGGITAYGLFKTSIEMAAVNDFTSEVKEEFVV